MEKYQNMEKIINEVYRQIKLFELIQIFLIQIVFYFFYLLLLLAALF